LGKCKTRLLSRARNEKNQLSCTRQEAINFVVQNLSSNPCSIPARNLISLFGLTAEELSEEGITYEILRSLDSLISSFTQ